MKQTEKEMLLLKEQINEMWRLVISQLEKAKEAFLESDVELALEVISREKRVNVYDLKVDNDCENFIALYNPVAIDLRLVLSLIKISAALERIGDFAEGFARYVVDKDCNDLDSELLEKLQIEKMFDTIIGMLYDCYVTLESENTKISGKILAQDKIVNRIYLDSFAILSEYARANPDFIECGYKVFLLIRKLERVGDHCSNIVEEIVFYIDAKILKHGGLSID